MPPLLAYFGHHKSASTWIHQILEDVCRSIGVRHRRLSNTRHLEGTLTEWIDQQRAEFVSYTNADFSEAKTLFPLRGFHVIRDPRDILVSGYFSHRNSHPTDAWPELEPHRNHLQEVSLEEGLLSEIEFSRRFMEEMDGWDYTLSEVMTFRMEEITTNPEEQFEEVFTHLGLLAGEEESIPWEGVTVWLNQSLRKVHLDNVFLLPRKLSRSRLKRILDRHSFEKKTAGRARGEEDRASHYRKGVAGDWKNHFTPAVAEAFSSAYGDLLVKLGYEKDQTWVQEVQ